jgi:hypothetical protein
MSPADENLNDIEGAANAYRNVRKILALICARISAMRFWTERQVLYTTAGFSRFRIPS